MKIKNNHMQETGSYIEEQSPASISRKRDLFINSVLNIVEDYEILSADEFLDKYNYLEEIVE